MNFSRSAIAFAWLSLIVLAGCGGEEGIQVENDINNWTSVTVGVTDMDVALTLWRDSFGMDVVVQGHGPDEDLARLWEIQAEDISRQALLATGSYRTGMLHLVEFVNPDPPVRRGANTFDLVPKNLDIYVQDMPTRMAELSASGQVFRNAEFSEVSAPDGTRFREIHMPTHDDINVVLLEVLGATKPLTSRQYGAIGPLIYIVPDANQEKTFVQTVFGLEKLTDNYLDGPEIEKMVGLPKGSALDVSIWGRSGNPLGELEVIDYQGVDGENLYPRAKPKATGVLHANFLTEDLSPLRARLNAAEVSYREYGSITTLLGTGDVVSFTTPAGLRIEVQEAASLQ